MKPHLRGLQHLRKRLEREAGGLSEEQVFLLADVCGALALDQNEMEYVLGKKLMGFLDAPVGYDLGPAAAVQGADLSPKLSYEVSYALAV